MTKKKPEDDDDGVLRQVQELVEQCAREEGISPALWVENLMDEAAEKVRQDPERAKRLKVMAEMERRIGRAIPNPEMFRLMDMHPEMSIEEFCHVHT